MLKLNILKHTNYKNVEKFLNLEASKGYILDNIYLGIFYLFKKTDKSSNIEYSIFPVKKENNYTGLSKADEDDFILLAKESGLEYISKLNNLEIYIKEKDSSSSSIYDSEIELREALKENLNSTLRNLKINIFIFSILLFINMANFNSSDGLKSNVFISVFFMIATYFIIIIKEFLEIMYFKIKNKNNFKNSNNNLYFNNYKTYRINNLISISLFTILLTIFLLFFISLLISSSDNNMIRYTYIGSISLIIPTLLLKFGVKSKLKHNPKYSDSTKKSKFTFYNYIVFIINVVLMFIVIHMIISFSQNTPNQNVDEFKNTNFVISYQNSVFNKNSNVDIKNLNSNFETYSSILVPYSYNYREYSKSNHKYGVETQYSICINDFFAIELGKRIIREVKNAEIGRRTYEDDEINPNDFIDNIVSSIDVEKIWNLDSGFYLSEEKDSILLRKGREVYVLKGLDFTNPEIISEIKNLMNKSRRIN